MVSAIIIVISLILDGLLTNYLPYTVGNLSLFTPLVTLISIFLIYPFYRKREKTYYISIIITGIIYDLLYTNLLFYNAILFLLIAFITKKIYKNFEVNYFNIILYTIILITIYESTQASLIIVFNLVPMTFSKLLYKIGHSLLLNIIYAEIVYFIIEHLPKKYKKININ